MKIEDLSFCVKVSEEGVTSVNGGDDFSDFIFSEDDFFTVDDVGTDFEPFVLIDSSRSTRFMLYQQGVS